MSAVEARLLLSVRSVDDMLYRYEHERTDAADGVCVHYTFTREPPPDWGGFARRIDAEMLRTVGPSPMRRPRIFVCGPTALSSRLPICSYTSVTSRPPSAQSASARRDDPGS